MGSPSVDAIVVAYKSQEVIDDCLRALRADEAVDTIIVVDNAPADGTRTGTGDVAGVTHVGSLRNVGFGPAINSVRHLVKADFVLLVNPDARQAPGTTTHLLDLLRDQPRAAAAAPRLVDLAGRTQRSSSRRASLSRMVFESLGGPDPLRLTQSEPAHERPHRTDSVLGAFVLCRVSALDEIGWFDESIFLFGEDQDLCRRLRKAGWEIWHTPAGTVVHESGHSWRQLTDAGRALFREARIRELRQERGPVSAQTYRLLVAVTERVRRRP